MSLPLFAENAKFEIKHQTTGEPTGLILELVPLDHDDIHAAKVDALKSLRARKLTDTADILIDLPTKISVLASAIVGWEITSDAWRDVFKSVFNFTDDTFSKEKILAVLSHPKSDWIRKQVDSAITDKESFFPEASTN